jgi:hypothetical protein
VREDVDDQLLGAVKHRKICQHRVHLLRSTGDQGLAVVRRSLEFRARPAVLAGRFDRRDRAVVAEILAAAPKQQAGGEVIRPCLGVGDDDPDSERAARGGRQFVVRRHRLQTGCRIQEVRERVRRTDSRGECGRGAARAEHPELGIVAEPLLQIGHVLREGLGRPACPAESQVDPAGIEVGQDAEHFGDFSDRVPREQDAARADSQLPGRAENDRYEDLRRRPREPGRTVVLGDPVPRHTQLVRGLGQLERGMQRLGRRTALADRRLVEDRQPRGCLLPTLEGNWAGHARLPLMVAGTIR